MPRLNRKRMRDLNYREIDFVTKPNREKFGEICEKCKYKSRCRKRKTSIVLKCINFANKFSSR